MDYLKKTTFKNNVAVIISSFVVLTPLFVSLVSDSSNALIAVISTISTLAAVAISPIFHRRENLGTLAAVLISMTLVSARISADVVDLLLGESFVIIRAMLFYVFFFFMLSVSEIIMGLLARVIWPTQDECIL